ncbi:MAG: hypothetical protein WBW69_16555 [Candidatus Korobacteraceae bacterium]
MLEVEGAFESQPCAVALDGMGHKQYAGIDMEGVESLLLAQSNAAAVAAVLG